jgi:hypothetical protein
MLFILTNFVKNEKFKVILKKVYYMLNGITIKINNYNENF